MLKDCLFPLLFPGLLDPFVALRVNAVVAASWVCHGVPRSATMPFPVLNLSADPSSTVLFGPNLTRSPNPPKKHAAASEPPSMTLRDSSEKMSAQTSGLSISRVVKHNGSNIEYMHLKCLCRCWIPRLYCGSEFTQTWK